MLTNERAERLANYLTSDTDRAAKLLNLDADAATALINADGNDFTVDEVMDFGKQLQAYAAQNQREDGELDAQALDSVAGGVVVAACIVAAGVALFTAGVTFGYTVARDRGW